MRPGFYMHRNAMDCFIEITRIQYQDLERLKARVRWLNLGYTGNPWVIRSNDAIEIKVNDLKNWISINPLTHRKLS